MRKFILCLISFGIIMAVIATCNKSVTPEETPEIVDPIDSTPPISVGMWHYALPPIFSITTDTLNIWLDITADSSYSLKLIERTDKTLFSSNGTWKTTADSLFLTGNDCMLLDTSSEPDTLAALDDTTCSKPFALAQPTNGSAWTIETQSIAAILVAFPIPEELLSSIPLVFPEIPLTKVEE